MELTNNIIDKVNEKRRLLEKVRSHDFLDENLKK